MVEVSRRNLLASAGAVGLAAAWPGGLSAAPAAAGPGDGAAIAYLADVADRLIAEYPENASSYGIDKDKRAGLRAQLTDRSAVGDKARAEWAGETLTKLQAIDRTRLSPGIATDVDVTQEAFRLAVAGWKFPYGDMAVLSGENSFRNSPYVFTQLSGALVDVPDFLESKHVVATAQDADAYLARIEAYAGELNAEADRFIAQRDAGVIPPSFLMDMMFTQRILASIDVPEKWSLVTSFKAKLDKAGLPDRYATQAAALCGSKVQAGIDRQMDALRTTRNSAWSEPGVWKQPQGADYYAWALRAGTTTTNTADDMHRLGREMVTRLQSEMDAQLKIQGLSQGTVGERMAALAKRPDMLFSNDDEGRAKLLAFLQGRIDDIRGRMPRAFATLVKGNLVIKRVPPAIEDGAPNGYAAPGSIDGSLPGNYYINLKDTHNWPRYALPTLCYHEGIPGHVWQGEYANNLPLIRTHLAFNAYSEGWALYSEQLGDELGAYENDPFGRIGYLQSIAFRACRLVIDTGLHAKQWTVDQALQWAMANTGMPEAALRAEIVRYAAMPGQACGYKMGHNQINMLRLRAQTELGAKYDFRRFNDAMVLSGNVPLTLLGTIADRYIASARG